MVIKTRSHVLLSGLHDVYLHLQLIDLALRRVLVDLSELHFLQGGLAPQLLGPLIDQLDPLDPLSLHAAFSHEAKQLVVGELPLALSYGFEELADALLGPIDVHGLEELLKLLPADGLVARLIDDLEGVQERDIGLLDRELQLVDHLVLPVELLPLILLHVDIHVLQDGLEQTHELFPADLSVSRHIRDVEHLVDGLFRDVELHAVVKDVLHVVFRDQVVAV